MKGKKCPSCGLFNQLNTIICTGCGEDLLRVPISDGEDIIVPKAEVEEEKEPAVFFRKCPRCHKVSPYHLSRCECGYILLSLPPYEEGKEESIEQPVQEKKDEKILYLVSDDGRFKLPLHVGDEFVLGRKETGADYFYAKTFVSGRHLRVRVTEVGVFVEHIGKTNPTLVNQTEIKTNLPYSVSVNDWIVMGARWGQDHVYEAAYLKLVAKDDV